MSLNSFFSLSSVLFSTPDGYGILNVGHPGVSGGILGGVGLGFFDLIKVFGKERFMG